jgi:hypothetical protein
MINLRVSVLIIFIAMSPVKIKQISELRFSFLVKGQQFGSVLVDFYLKSAGRVVLIASIIRDVNLSFGDVDFKFI